MRRKTFQLAAPGPSSWSACFPFSHISNAFPTLQYETNRPGFSVIIYVIYFLSRVFSHTLTHLILQEYCEVNKQILIILISQIKKKKKVNECNGFLSSLS